jgi:hypothetical protein
MPELLGGFQLIEPVGVVSARRARIKAAAPSQAVQ